MRPSFFCLSSLALAAAVSVQGCKDLTGNPGLPAGTPNPSFYNNAAGALGMRNAAMSQVESAIPQYILDSGLLTDELEDINTGASQGVLFQSGSQVSDPLDERILPEGATGGIISYNDLQYIRTVATQALGALAMYDTAATARDSAKILRGELYALEGYAEILLSDLFCSGVPLSMLEYNKDFTYAPSSTWQQVYQAALAEEDSALTLADASDSVVNLALVLKGRAYLDLGNYVAAADDVTNVPDPFVYQVVVQIAANTKGSQDVSVWATGNATVSDREGVNGLPYISSHDPRTMVVTTGQPDPSNGGPFIPVTFPAKYSVALNGLGYAPVTLASGIEARLIQAEAQLHGVNTGTGSWIDKLNTLRVDSGLSTITDPGPGNPAAQVDTLFTERAYWLFLDGHRQGDLRRLLRQYGQYDATSAFRSENQVYPTGAYLAPGTGKYGSDWMVPIPTTEYANQFYHGCLNRDQ